MALAKVQGGIVTQEEMWRVVKIAVEMRPPRFPPDENGVRPAPIVKVTALEDYLLENAYVAAELEEVVANLDEIIYRLKEKVESMTGYELALPRKPQDRITEADRTAAKRTIDRETFEAGAEAKILRATALRQIERLRFESQWVVSRAYSMISGS